MGLLITLKNLIQTRSFPNPFQTSLIFLPLIKLPKFTTFSHFLGAGYFGHQLYKGARQVPWNDEKSFFHNLLISFFLTFQNSKTSLWINFSLFWYRRRTVPILLLLYFTRSKTIPSGMSFLITTFLTKYDRIYQLKLVRIEVFEKGGHQCRHFSLW